MARTGLFLFTDDTAQQPGGDSLRKGRSARLLSRRDQMLVHRYAYYIVYTELRPDAVNERLEAEFCITPKVFLTIIYDRAGEIKNFKRQPFSLAQLRALYPHLVWTATKSSPSIGGGRGEASFGGRLQ